MFVNTICLNKFSCIAKKYNKVSQDVERGKIHSACIQHLFNRYSIFYEVNAKDFEKIWQISFNLLYMA